MHIEQQLDIQPSPSTADVMQLKQKWQNVRDEGMLGPETVRRHAGEPTSKLAADSTLSPKVDCAHLMWQIIWVYIVLFGLCFNPVGWVTEGHPTCKKSSTEIPKGYFVSIYVQLCTGMCSYDLSCYASDTIT